MKKILKIIVLLLITQVYAQKNEVIYSASFRSKVDTEKIKQYSPEARKAFIDVMTKSNNIDYKLVFNKDLSLFQKIEQMENDGSKLNLTEVFAGSGKYFFDVKKNKTIEQNDTYGEFFLIERKKLKWNLTNETKKIGNYTCKKATTMVTVETRRGKFNKDVIAWYTPDIPVSFGPKIYNGLPGLILQLEKDGLTFTAKKITLNAKGKLDLEKPTKGKKITEEEFNAIGKKMNENRRR